MFTVEKGVWTIQSSSIWVHNNFDRIIAFNFEKNQTFICYFKLPIENVGVALITLDNVESQI